MPTATLADRIDALLPQTQCTRCGYAACRPYAEAVAVGSADVNRCPPGGEDTIAALAALTGRETLPLDPACGAHGPRLVATIDESRCIGCRLCIDACPVDAIIGAPKRMHVVLASWCSGCELCVAPCPVDCIGIAVAGVAWTTSDAADARERHRARATRLALGERVSARTAASGDRAVDDAGRRSATVAAAIERARARRAAHAT